MMKKLTQIVLFFLILFSVDSFAQNTLLFKSNYLWLKSEKTKSKDSTKIEQYLNFNNALDFSSKDHSKIYKNLITNKGALFLVFKSDAKEDLEIVTLKNKNFKVELFNNKVVTDKETLFDENVVKNGVLVDYLYCNNSSATRKKGSLKLNDLLFDDSQNNNAIFEIIYIPEAIGAKKKSIIETYLSFKYGISLAQDKNYLNSKGDTLWNPKNHKEFNHRITAIGTDSGTGLQQFKSKNSTNDGLTIGIEKTKNELINTLLDGSYVVWGDNNKETSFKTNSQKSKKVLQRIWNLKTISADETALSTRIVFDKQLMKIESRAKQDKDVFFWIAIDSISSSNFNYATAKLVKATQENENEIIFEDVKFKANSEYFFTLIEAKKSDLEDQQQSEQSKTLVADGFSIYPNPVDKNQMVTVDFHLNIPSKVEVSIFDSNGKLIKAKDLGLIDTYTHKETLQTSGTYFIQVSINGTIQSSKLLVR